MKHYLLLYVKTNCTTLFCVLRGWRYCREAMTVFQLNPFNKSQQFMADRVFKANNLPPHLIPQISPDHDNVGQPAKT